MESFSLLKYWRTSGVGVGGATTGDSIVNSRAATKSIVAAAAAVTPYFSDGEDGPYFDLEFALPDEYSDQEEEKGHEDDKKMAQRQENETESSSEDLSEDEHEEEEEEEEVKLTLASSESTDGQNVTLSPSDELFFKGNLVSIEPSSVLLNESEENSNFRVSLLKSATKFRVLLLKLKKSKSGNGVLDKAEKNEVKNGEEASATAKIQEKQGNKMSGKFFTVKFKVEEVKVPLVSLFTRDNSSKQTPNCKESKHTLTQESESNLDERKLSKEVVQKYLKMVKPLYVRVSKRYVEKLKFSGNISFPGGGSKAGGGAAPPSAAAEKGGEVAAGGVKSSNLKHGNNNNLQAGLKVVRKHLGKSRSASAALAAPPPPGNAASNRRDDSLVQLQDGIQGAIMHCKKSFNSSRDGEGSSILCRSVSDPSHEKSVTIPTVSSAAKSSVSGEAKEIN